MSVDLVISAYKDDLNWISYLPRNGVSVHVYDKWDGPASAPVPPVWDQYCKLPNVGKIDHTILHHIVTWYDNLADWTVFAPDDPFPHMGGKYFAEMLKQRDKVLVPWLCTLRDWGTDGRLEWAKWTNRTDANGTNWAERYASGKITKAFYSFTRFAGIHGIRLDNWPGYHPGAVLGVPKAAILLRSRTVYEMMLESVSGSIEPEEGHYLERLWISLFRS